MDRLGNYLKLSAKKQQKDDMTRVYVAVDDGQASILGYHAINLGMMNAGVLAKPPRGAPDHGELPILFLEQVAVSKSAQGEGIGSILMHHVFEKACRVAEEAGCFAIVLDIMSDGGEEASGLVCRLWLSAIREHTGTRVHRHEAGARARRRTRRNGLRFLPRLSGH